MDTSRTITLSGSSLPAFGFDSQVATALWIVDSSIVHELPRGSSGLKIGRSTRRADIYISSPHASGIQCEVLPRDGRLLLRDTRWSARRSKNATIFEGVRVGRKGVDLKPGDVFSCADADVLVMSNSMRAQLAALIEICGHGAVALAREAVLGSRHILIISKPNCDQLRLAHSIHDQSWRAGKPLVVVERHSTSLGSRMQSLKSADGSSLVLDLDTCRPLGETFAKALFDPAYRVRLIVIAPTRELASSVLGAEAVGAMHEVWLHPLATRSDQLSELLDGAFDALKSSVRTSMLTQESQNRLKRYSWPQNFVTLRRIAHYLATLYERRSMRAGAEALGVPVETFRSRLYRAGVDSIVFQEWKDRPRTAKR